MPPAASPARLSLVLYAKDKPQLARFYQAVLGLEVVEEAPGFTVLAGSGMELSIVAIPETIAASIDITTPPAPREETPLKASFLVANLAAVGHQVAELGGTVKPLAAAWVWRGCRHLDGCDPEGNVVEFRERESRAAGGLSAMKPDTANYNQTLEPDDRAIGDLVARVIDETLPEAENKIWHAHPVWFLDGNPVVGYSKLKGCVRLLFWSGQSFEEEGLRPEGKFKAAEARFTAASQVDVTDLRRWLGKAREIQWDYENIVKRKGKLVRRITQ